MNAKLIIGIVLAAIAVLFTIQNVSSVELTFLVWTISISRALLVFLFTSAGIILGWLLHGGFNKRKRDTRAKQNTDWIEAKSERKDGPIQSEPQL